MQLGCTKKLLDYMKVNVDPVDTQLDPFLTWSANIITVNHRKTIVVANDSSRYGFVLYGIKSKDIKDFSQIVFDGIRSCLEVECIDPSLIERYLKECKDSITYTKTANPSVVARLNQLCTRVWWFVDEFSSDQLFQRQVVFELNDDMITMKDGDHKGYGYVYEKLGENFSKHYAMDPYRCKGAEFEIVLELESVCRRTITVPLNYTFHQFHTVIQKLFCWKDQHLHDFWIERHPNGHLKQTLVGFPREYDVEEESVRDDASVFLWEIFPEHDHIIYNYDFGDNWIHHIRFLHLIDEYDKNHAVCIQGEGDAPPEDVGGPGEYARLLNILSDPQNPEYESMKTWYDPKFCLPFDLKWINLRLRR